MNKLLTVLCASAFAFCSMSILADDSSMKPLSKLDTQEAKAAKAAAQAKWDAMTPEQKAAARKAARQKKLADATALDEVANDNMAYDATQGAKNAAASKAGPAPAKGTMNTPQAEQTLKQQKGQ